VEVWHQGDVDKATTAVGFGVWIYGSEQAGDNYGGVI
jgi:hypothetical protein